MKTFQPYVLILLIICSLASCENKKMATDQNDIVVELSEREKRLIQHKISLDSINKELEWKEIRDGLYINKKGDLGFKVMRMLSERKYAVDYITCFFNANPLKEVIDINTFKLIAGDNAWGGYYKDKNNIYHYFGTSGGGSFSIVQEADYTTFEVLKDCYMRDKNHIYDLRFGVMEEVDAATFKVVSDKHSCLAKDKNGYYEGNSKLSEEELTTPEFQKLKNKLDKK